MPRPTDAVPPVNRGRQPRQPGPAGGRPGGGGLRGLIAALNRLFGQHPKGPARPPASGAGPSPTMGGEGTGLHVPAGWQAPVPPAAQLRWKKDLWGLAPSPRTKARAQTIQRQVLLVLVALVTLLVVGVILVSQSLVDRTLPAAVRGVWQTDAPRYQQRLFELAGSRIAFQVSDSAVAIHQAVRVRRSDGEAGTTYRVEYRDRGDLYEFTFVHSAGPPEEIRFAHQPFMVWTRVTDRRRLLPELF